MATSKYMMCYAQTIESDNLRLLVHRRFEDVRDQMCDSPRPQWQGCNDYIVDIKELKVEYETIELKVGGTAKYRQETVGRSISFNSDWNFVECIRMIAEKYDDFDTVVNAARVLLQKAE